MIVGASDDRIFLSVETRLIISLSFVNSLSQFCLFNFSFIVLKQTSACRNFSKFDSNLP